MSVISDGVALLREEGPSEFLGGVGRHLRWCAGQYSIWVRSRLAAARGRTTLSVGDASAAFVAADADSVAATLRRHRSERAQLAAVLADLEPGDVFYDVGANTGLYACLAASRGSRVVAFEPYPPNVAELRRNAARNGIDASIHEVALSDESGTVGFETEDGTNLNDPGADSPGFGRGRITADRGDLEVPAVRGDTLIDEGAAPPPTVVKIDVEGAESSAIDGLAGALSNDRCRVVYCEVHEPSELPALLERFRDLGFDVAERLETDKDELVVRASRNRD
ncbi:FkbM family methyltransferase [Natronococcus sp. JC468]|uniref:FkbM family methyltransferase n=1 Tax=Natronococcus sp. JC468 TaxID=1961921 RepID=UPI00143C54A3|nr:FkbM family methyltransferase [Natronococcus sp. JC468]NKE37410.1 FkbM family methyltransferase [Natronococcus sp. JC468]